MTKDVLILSGHSNGFFFCPFPQHSSVINHSAPKFKIVGAASSADVFLQSVFGDRVPIIGKVLRCLFSVKLAIVVHISSCNCVVSI